MKTRRYFRLLNVLYVIVLLITLRDMLQDGDRTYISTIIIFTIGLDFVVAAIRYIATGNFNLRILSQIKKLIKIK